MNPGTKLAALNKFRSGHSVLSRQGALRVLVVYDVQIKASDVTHVPLVINYGQLRVRFPSLFAKWYACRFAQSR